MASNSFRIQQCLFRRVAGPGRARRGPDHHSRQGLRARLDRLLCRRGLRRRRRCVNKVNTSGGGAALNVDGLGSSGVLGSIYGGVDYQVLPKAIIGALAEATWSGFQSSASAQVPGAGATPIPGPASAGALLGRAGVLANPSTLLYLVGGYTGQNVRTSGTAVAGGAVASFSRNDTVHGWTVGPGFETMLTRRLVGQARVSLQPVRRDDTGRHAITVQPSRTPIRLGLTTASAD